MELHLQIIVFMFATGSGAHMHAPTRKYFRLRKLECQKVSTKIVPVFEAGLISLV